MPTKKANTATAKNIKKTANEVNCFLIETSEMIIDETINRTLAWQNVADKAIKGGFTIAAKQQDLIFDTLETFKNQVVDTKKKFNKRFSKN